MEDEGMDSDNNRNGIASIVYSVISVVIATVAIGYMLVENGYLVRMGSVLTSLASSGNDDGPFAGISAIGIALTVALSLAMLLSIKTIIECIWSELMICVRTRELIGTLFIELAASVMLVATYMSLPTLCCTFPIGIFVDMAVLVVLYFFVPGGRTKSFVPAYARDARARSNVSDVLYGDASVKVSSSDEMAETIGYIDAETKVHAIGQDGDNDRRR